MPSKERRNSEFHYESENTTSMNNFHRYAAKRKKDRFHAEIRDLIIQKRVTWKDLISKGVKINHETYCTIMIVDPSRTVSEEKLMAVKSVLV